MAYQGYHSSLNIGRHLFGHVRTGNGNCKKKQNYLSNAGTDQGAVNERVESPWYYPGVQTSLNLLV